MTQPSPTATSILEEIVDNVNELLVVFSTQVDILEASRATWDGGPLLSEEGSEVHALGGNVLNSHG